MCDQERLSRIRPDLRVEILHHDEAIIVIAKPGGLRSVPGHAQPPPLASTSDGKGPRNNRKRSRSQDDNESSSRSANCPGQADQGGGEVTDTSSTPKRQRAQEAWENAIRSFASQPLDLPPTQPTNGEMTLAIEQHPNGGPGVAAADPTVMARIGLTRLAANDNALSSIPRKWKLFHRYIIRNRRRLVQEDVSTEADDKCMEAMANVMFRHIQQRQKPLLNLPDPTLHEDSAFGQLVLMGYSDQEDASSSNALPEQKLFVVHRLDCETSGVMVFARTPTAASFLCRAWRDRNQVTKTYLAKVKSWPPYHMNHRSEGSITVPLAPSEERLKWKVVEENDANARPSTTLWWIHNHDSETIGTDDDRGAPIANVGSSAPTNADQNIMTQHYNPKASNHHQQPVVLRLMPKTGRTHQLRIHCAHVGSGIMGDSLYGDDRLDNYLIETLDQQRDSGRRLCLHAYKLAFPHPITKEVQEFYAPPPYECGTCSGAGLHNKQQRTSDASM